MIDGMSEICIDCVHQEVCRYECHCPSGHCNDYAVADDFIPPGEWEEDSGNIACSHCHTIWLYRRTDFCPNCGAKMQKEGKKE